MQVDSQSTLDAPLSAEAAELLQPYDAHGRPLPGLVRRDLVHQLGLWHRSFHCWLVRPSPRGAELLLQQRSLAKATWPGAWDVSAAGHYQGGEGIAGGCREIAEELGLAVESDELHWWGRHREQLRYANGLRDRELQDVYLLRCDLPPTAFAPDPGEVVGLAWVRAAALVALAEGQFRSLTVPGRVLGAADWTEQPVRLVRSRLVTRTGHYYARIARAAERLVRRAAARGSPHRRNTAPVGG